MDTNPYPIRVAKVVARAMEAKGLTENGLATATGIPRVTLRRRLAGSPFNVAELEAIATALDVTVTDLVGEVAA